MNKINWYHLIFIALFSGCTFKAAEFTGIVHKSEGIAQDIQIPKIIFDTINSNIRNESSSATPVYLFQHLEVVFASEKSNVMSSSHRYIFSSGGGRVDLKTILSGQGSFSFYFPEHQFEKLPELEHLYFISEYPKKLIDQETFGLGCGQWIDLKNKFSQLKKLNGLTLNTTAARHLYVAGGYYVFVFRRSNQVYLTHLHLTDSRFPQLKCPLVAKESEPAHE